MHTRDNAARFRLCMALGIALLAMTAGAACLAGGEPIGVADFFKILGARIGECFGGDGALPTALETPRVIVEQLRLPRVGTAVAAGAALALAGCAMQGIFRNPLADPSLLGVSGGAAVGAALCLVCALPLLPLWAFAGGVLVSWALFQTSKVGGRVSVVRMLLAGIAVNALAGAIIGFLIFISEAPQLRDIAFWSMGSLAGATPAVALGLLAAAGAGYLLLRALSPALNALLLGEAEAAHLGVRVGRVQGWAVCAGALLVALTVSFCGVVSFLGLVAPHLARLCVGPDHRRLVPVSALFGALILLIADTAARVLAAPAELPIGILTALVGAPFFLALLWSSRKRYAYFQ